MNKRKQIYLFLCFVFLGVFLLMIFVLGRPILAAYVKHEMAHPRWSEGVGQ